MILDRDTVAEALYGITDLDDDGASPQPYSRMASGWLWADLTDGERQYHRNFADALIARQAEWLLVPSKDKLVNTLYAAEGKPLGEQADRIHALLTEAT